MIPTGGGTSSLYRQELVDGSSPVVSVGDDATTLVLYRGEEELEGVPLTLEPGQVTLVEF